jgi:hypothetical protein
MKATIHALALFSTVALAGAAHAACSRPPEPTIPDGASASQEEMVQGQQAVKAFVKDTTAYVDCVDAEEKDVAAKAEGTDTPMTPEQHNGYVDRHNAGVDSMQKVAEAFNAQLRVYLDKTKKK